VRSCEAASTKTTSSARISTSPIIQILSPRPSRRHQPMVRCWTSPRVPCGSRTWCARSGLGACLKQLQWTTAAPCRVRHPNRFSSITTGAPVADENATSGQYFRSFSGRRSSPRAAPNAKDARASPQPPLEAQPVIVNLLTRSQVELQKARLGIFAAHIASSTRRRGCNNGTKSALSLPVRRLRADWRRSRQSFWRAPRDWRN
jgi:hypothetical protein